MKFKRINYRSREPYFTLESCMNNNEYDIKIENYDRIRYNSSLVEEVCKQKVSLWDSQGSAADKVVTEEEFIDYYNRLLTEEMGETEAFMQQLENPFAYIV